MLFFFYYKKKNNKNMLGELDTRRCSSKVRVSAARGKHMVLRARVILSRPQALGDLSKTSTKYYVDRSKMPLQKNSRNGNKIPLLFNFYSSLH